MTGNNPTDRSKLGTKRHILTDKNDIPPSAVITPASVHDIKAVTDVIDNSVNKQLMSSLYTIKKKEKKTVSKHLCLDRVYSSKSIENKIFKRRLCSSHTI